MFRKKSVETLEGIADTGFTMNVRIGNLEVTNVTPDELDMLIKRFGNVSSASPSQRLSTKSPGDANKQSVSTTGTPNDIVALRRLVEAGSGGVKTNDIGEILGKRGKGARRALRNWSKRIGLTNDADATMDTFEDCRVGTSRGVRIRPNLLEVARVLMNNHQ